MNVSVSEIVDQVFQEYTPKIAHMSSKPKLIEQKMNEMKTDLMQRIYAQNYNTTMRFMIPVDLDDVFSSSPPRERMIQKCVPETPQK